MRILLHAFFLLLATHATAIGAATTSAIEEDQRYPFLREIIVRLDQASGKWPDLDSLIERLNLGDRVVSSGLGEPVAARYLVQNRVLSKFLSWLPASDARVRLHEAIVLTYSDNSHASAAESLLRDNAAVKHVERSRGAQFASSPNDPLLINGYVDVDVSRYQWGPQRLNLLLAWEKVRGTAYTAILDNGIQVHGFNSTIHEDLEPNFRRQFAYNFELLNGVTNPGQHGGGNNSADNVDEEPFSIYDINNNLIQANIAGHGTHTAGIVGAKANNSLGVAGTCQYCSLMIGRITAFTGGGSAYPSMPAIASGLAWMIYSGSQVINNSFGGPPSQGYDCTSFSSVCDSLQAAASNDVVVVAAAGNDRVGVDFFANQSGVIAVAGAQYDSSGAAFWDGSVQNGRSFGSNRGSEVAIAAPAASVISSVYTGTDWNSGFPDSRFACGDGFPSGYYAGYGICTGTSMSTAFVSGIAALTRSVFPTATRNQVRSFLVDTAKPCASDPNGYCGAGFADAMGAVTKALGGAGVANRLTPLFSFYSSDRYDHVYTAVPQMGTAAILGTLLPTSYTGNQYGYASIGPLSPGYAAFPGVPLSGCEFSPPCDPLYPRAMLSVFTTFRNPNGPSPDLVALYRYSYACPNSVPTYCGNHEHVSHVYSADPSEGWTSAGYKLDGVEGYIFPKTMSQPPGTVKLCRRYYPAHDDYILFPGSGSSGTDCSAYTDGYTPGGNNYTSDVLGTDWIGWAYLVRSPQPVYSRPLVMSIIYDDD